METLDYIIKYLPELITGLITGILISELIKRKLEKRSERKRKDWMEENNVTEKKLSSKERVVGQMK